MSVAWCPKISIIRLCYYRFQSIEHVITDLKLAQNKGDDPWSLDKARSANHDTLNALRHILLTDPSYKEFDLSSTFGCYDTNIIDSYLHYWFTIYY